MAQGRTPKATPSRPTRPRPTDSHPPDASAAPLWLSVVLFAGSGCAALIYELVWFQLLQLVVGSTAISLGILLATFMGGLGLGSLLQPRVVSDRHHPFRVYGVLELGIGLMAILILFGVPLIGSLYTGAGDHGLTGLVLRAVIAGLCLLPPTILMGAALPAVARWVKATPRGVSWVGLLYGSNTAGAVLGCVLAGFYLLRVYDMATATYVAVAINAVISLISFHLAARTARHVVASDSTPVPRLCEGHACLVYFVIAVSGMCALGAEVIWTRILSLLLGPTVYTFTIILAVFLFGLGVGSCVASVLARRSTNPQRDLGICQIALAAAIAWSAFVVCCSLPYWPIVVSISSSPWISFQVDLVRCLWAILPAPLLWGASVPLALAAAAPRARDSGRLVGAVYAANTVGAIVGALFFGLLVVQWFGTQTAQRILVALSGLVGLMILAPWAWPPWKSRAHGARAVAVVAAALVAFQLAANVPAVPGALIAHGRRLPLRLSLRDPQTRAPLTPNVLYAGEGLNASVAVTEEQSVRVFHVSGKNEASTSPNDMRLQRMLGHLPALMHPNPRSVLVVGFGAGVTAGSFVPYPGIQRIVICEIEPLIPQVVSKYFAAVNNDVLHDPRVEVVYDDARHYILTTREKFDIITSDPIHPWVKGAAALYTREYFELVRRHLNPGGVVTQWVPLYETGVTTVRDEMATFFDAFPQGTIWANTDGGRGYDVVLLGTDGPPAFNVDRLRERLERPDHAAVARSLQAVGLGSALDLMATYAGRGTDLAPWLAGAQINRDCSLRLQYEAGMESYTQNATEILGVIAAYRRFPQDLFASSDSLGLGSIRGGGSGASSD